MFRERRFIGSDGLSLYWRDYGPPRSDRIPLLCLPGLTRNCKDFEDLAARHAPVRRILCPDYRGRGQSAYAEDWRHYRVEFLLNDIRHLLTVAGEHRVIVVGTSLGGILGTAMMATQPTALAGLVLNDVGPELQSGGMERVRRLIECDRPQPDWDSAARFLARAMPRLSLRSHEEWLRFAHNTYREGADGLLHYDWDPRVGRALWQDRVAAFDLWPLFRTLREVPVLALRGELSDVLSRDTFDRMAAALPHLRRVEIPGVGHAPTFAEPAAQSALDDFLASQ